MQEFEHPFKQHKRYFELISLENRPKLLRKMIDLQQTQKQIDLPIEEFPIQFDHLVDQTSYHISIWQPKRPAKGIIFVFPGMNYHVGNSHIFAKYMVQNCDMIVAGYDYKNFGKSKGKQRGKYQNIDKIVLTSETIIQFIRGRYDNNLKVFISGHSFGGALCFKLALQQPKKYSGIIFFSPALRQNKEYYPLGKKLLKCFGSVFPFLPTVKHSGLGGVKYTGLNKCIINDPHINNDRFILGNLNFILDLMREIEEQYHLLDTPYILFQSGVEKCLDPFLAIDLEKNAKTEDKYTVYCKDMWHNVWFEDQLPQINKIVEKWLSLRV